LKNVDVLEKIPISNSNRAGYFRTGEREFETEGEKTFYANQLERRLLAPDLMGFFFFVLIEGTYAS